MIHVVGGSGFIGTRLCQRLKSMGEECEFSIVDRTKSVDFPDKCRVADVRSLDELRLALESGSIIVNLAAEHRDDVTPKSLYEEVNVGGARNICKVAVEKNIETIVFTSSVAVYGFAPPGTDESGAIAPFNEYGRSKYAAEVIFRDWLAGAPESRRLVIIRPTVVFGERNRGNVYNLLKQISSRMFVMIGSGQNRKSMAYVENIAAFIQFSLAFPPGMHIYNYVDKPDFQISQLVAHVFKLLGKKPGRVVVPVSVGLLVGRIFDGLSAILGRKFVVSHIRVKKFCADSMFSTNVASTGFSPPVSLSDALKRTVEYEFLNKSIDDNLFYSE